MYMKKYLLYIFIIQLHCRKLPPVPGTNSNYNTIDRIKKGNALLYLKKYPFVKLKSLFMISNLCSINMKSYPFLFLFYSMIIH